MVTIKVKFRKSSIEEKEGVLLFRLIYQRQVRNLTTKYRLYSDEWDSACECVCFNTSSVRRKNYLKEIQNSLITDMCLLKKTLTVEFCKANFSLNTFVDAYKNKASLMTLSKWMNLLITELIKYKKNGTAKSYKNCLRSFNNFYQKEISMDLIDSNLMINYQKYLLSKNNCLNTVSFYMRILRAVYNKAVESNLISQKYPFTSVYTGIAKTEKRAVNAYVIYKLKQAKLDKYPNLLYARDLFLLSFYLRGISFVDLANLKKENIENGFLRYIRSKTQQELTIKLETCAITIIECYNNNDSQFLLPILKEKSRTTDYESKLRLYNKNLRDLSLHLELNTILSSYVARHTWATLAKRQGIELAVISEALGHNSLQTTQIYLDSLDQERIDNANSLVIGMVG